MNEKEIDYYRKFPSEWSSKMNFLTTRGAPTGFHNACVYADNINDGRVYYSKEDKYDMNKNSGCCSCCSEINNLVGFSYFTHPDYLDHLFASFCSDCDFVVAGRLKSNFHINLEDEEKK